MVTSLQMVGWLFLSHGIRSLALCLEWRWNISLATSYPYGPYRPVTMTIRNIGQIMDVPRTVLSRKKPDSGPGVWMQLSLLTESMNLCMKLHKCILNKMTRCPPNFSWPLALKIDLDLDPWYGPSNFFPIALRTKIWAPRIGFMGTRNQMNAFPMTSDH